MQEQWKLDEKEYQDIENTSSAVHSSKASRVWLGLCLWLVICVGELGWVTQSSLALWLWTALFTLPGLYVTSRSALDALVDEGVLFILSAIQGGKSLVLFLAIEAQRLEDMLCTA